MSDAERVERVREALYQGALAEAQGWAAAIADAALRRQMQDVVRDYEYC